MYLGSHCRMTDTEAGFAATYMDNLGTPRPSTFEPLA
jgi:hypothetical protein